MPADTWSRPWPPAPDAALIDRLGYTYFLRGDLGEAERYYHQAAEVGPDLLRPAPEPRQAGNPAPPPR